MGGSYFHYPSRRLRSRYCGTEHSSHWRGCRCIRRLGRWLGGRCSIRSCNRARNLGYRGIRCCSASYQREAKHSRKRHYEDMDKNLKSCGLCPIAVHLATPKRWKRMPGERTVSHNRASCFGSSCGNANRIDAMEGVCGVILHPGTSKVNCKLTPKRRTKVPRRRDQILHQTRKTSLRAY